MKDETEKAIKEAISNSRVDQQPLNKAEMEVIREALNSGDKSFFRKLYELVNGEKDEKQHHKSR